MKVCKHCKIELTSEVKHEGLQCKTCRNGLTRYGLNRLDQLELLESQDRSCKICGNEVDLFIGNRLSAVIDHCHSTEKVRGILCRPCNTALGQIETVGTEAFLQNVESYIKGD